MSEVSECLSCGEPFIVSDGRKKFCGKVCAASHTKSVAREKYRIFLSTLTDYQKIQLEIALEEEWIVKHQNIYQDNIPEIQVGLKED